MAIIDMVYHERVNHLSLHDFSVNGMNAATLVLNFCILSVLSSSLRVGFIVRITITKKKSS